MPLRPVCVRGSLFALAVGAASPALAAIELVGATQATFTWQPASGPVSGYVIYQLCDANGQTLKSSVTTNRATFTPQACSAFSVQVAAYGVGGIAETGPLSDPSELVRFLAAAPAPDPIPSPDPAPTPAPPVTTPPSAPAVSDTDFDADGRSEVLLHRPSDGSLTLSSLEGEGLVPATSLPAFPPGARVVGNGDYDGDGHPDLLGLDRGQVFLWLMRGSTPFGVNELHEPLAATDSVEGCGDYDGDGVSDVLIRRPELARVEVWSLRGGAIEAIDALATDPGADWSIVGSGDHDGDGRADVLWQHKGSGSLVLWHSLGRVGFEPLPVAQPLGPGWRGVAVADFDGNGAADVIWRHVKSGKLALSLFEAGAVSKLRLVGSGERAPLRELVGSGDFDGDGNLDVLVRNVGTPALELWRLRAGSLLSASNIADLEPGWSPAGIAAESPSSQRWVY